jgi:hypothetical protein
LAAAHHKLKEQGKPINLANLEAVLPEVNAEKIAKPPYFVCENLLDSPPQSPKAFGFTATHTSLSHSVSTINRITSVEGSEQSSFYNVIRSAPKKLQLLLISLETAAFDVYVTEFLKASPKIYEDFSQGVNDGLLAYGSDLDYKLLYIYFKIFQCALKNELYEDADQLPEGMVLLDFGKDVSTIFLKNLEEDYSPYSLEWTTDMGFLIFHDEITAHGREVLYDTLPNNFKVKLINDY